MMRPNLRLAHALDHRPAHVEQRIEIGVDHRAPLLGRHAVEHGVAGDAGIVDQHLDRAEIGLDLLEAGGAGLVGGDVPLVDRDAGLGLELLRRLVVAAVVGGDLVAGGLQRLRDRRADPARSARHHRNACHAIPPWPYFRCRHRRRQRRTRRHFAGPSSFRPAFLNVVVALYRSTHMAMPMPPPMQSVARPFLALRFCIS